MKWIAQHPEPWRPQLWHSEVGGYQIQEVEEVFERSDPLFNLSKVQANDLDEEVPYMPFGTLEEAKVAGEGLIIEDSSTDHSGQVLIGLDARIYLIPEGKVRKFQLEHAEYGKAFNGKAKDAEVWLKARDFTRKYADYRIHETDILYKKS